MKKICSYIMMLLLTCCLAGCGENSSSELDQKELVYGYERLACMDEIKGEVKSFVANEDYLYFCTGEYAQPESMGEEMAQAHFYKCRSDGSDLKELPVKWKLDEFEWLHSMEVSRSGNLWLLYSAYSEERMSNTYILRLVEESGKVLEEIDINDHMDVEDFFVADIKVDADDNLYINTGYSVLILDTEGDVAEIEEEEFIENLICIKDGSVVAGFGHEDGYKLKKIDPKTATFSETYDTLLPFYEITIGIDGVAYDFYYHKGESLYGYDLATGESAEVLNFIASALNTNSLGEVQVLSGDTVLAIYGVADEMDPYGIYLLQKKDPKDVKIKKIVTYASPYPDAEAKEQAILFNRSQDKYLVVMKDYQYSENPEMELYKDIRSGEVIDIVDFSGLSSEKYIAQDMFVDLYKFMKRDKVIKKEDFIEHILGVMETDGKLYHISPTVGMNVITAKASDVDTSVPLTFEMIEKMESEGVKAFYRESKMSVLTNALELNYESYINWTQGICSFDSEEFIALLEYADTYPDSDENMWEEDAESLTSKIKNGEVLFATVLSVTPEDLQLYEEMYEEDVVWIGFPFGQYAGAAMSMNRDLAICASSTDKKGAWEFLKTFLSREYVSGYPGEMSDVPIRKDSLEDRIKRYTTEEDYVDEFGQEISPLSYEWGYEDLEIVVKPLNAEQEAIYRNAIQSMDHKYVYDYDMVTIVSEEAEPYFGREISAEEAAANIQKRAAVYMEDYEAENE